MGSKEVIRSYYSDLTDIIKDENMRAAVACTEVHFRLPDSEVRLKLAIELEAICQFIKEYSKGRFRNVNVDDLYKQLQRKKFRATLKEVSPEFSLLEVTRMLKAIQKNYLAVETSTDKGDPLLTFREARVDMTLPSQDVSKNSKKLPSQED